MLEKESASHVNSSETWSLHGRRNIEHISCTETNDFSVLKLVLSHFVDLERLLSQRNLTNVNPTGISMSLLTNATLFLNASLHSKFQIPYWSLCVFGTCDMKLQENVKCDSLKRQKALNVTQLALLKRKREFVKSVNSQTSNLL